MKTHDVLYKISSWLPVFIICALIFYISSYQTATVLSAPQDEFVLKKFAHILWSSSLALFSYRAFVREGLSKKKASLYAILFVFFYGSTDEIHQRFVIGRESRFRDVIIDTLGASLAILGLWILLPKMPQRLKSWASRWDLL